MNNNQCSKCMFRTNHVISPECYTLNHITSFSSITAPKAAGLDNQLLDIHNAYEECCGCRMTVLGNLSTHDAMQMKRIKYRHRP